MKFQRPLYLFLLLSSIGCYKNNPKSIVINNERAEGNISRDSVFNGLIKFYDIKTNKLVSECNYINGAIEGERKDYYLNGKLSARTYYKGGRLFGSSYIYDTSGMLEKKEHYYYDIRVGESIKFKEGKLSEFYFYSLDGVLLFSIKYDSISTKRITDFQSDFFFIRDREYSSVVADEGTTRIKAKEFFLYTPNPPNYNFRYSLVKVDSLYKDDNTIQEFDGNVPWSAFDIEDFYTSRTNLKYAIKLVIYDSIAGGDITIYRRLE